MQRLLENIILFTLLIFGIIYPFVWINKRVINRPLNELPIFRLTPNIDTLIMGDSHAQASLDPNLIPGSINVSFCGESVFFTYYKLKYFIERNPGNLRNVVLAFSYHNISKKYQEESMVGGARASFSIGEYYQYLDSEGKKILDDSSSLMFYRLKYDFGIPLMEYKDLEHLKVLLSEPAKPRGYGCFYADAVCNLNKKSIIEKVKLYYLDDHSNYTGYSQIMIDYLDKIAFLCAKNHITLYLYNAPLNVATRRIIPAAAYKKYDSVVESLKTRYSNIIIFDISKEQIKDSSFYDGDHLNKVGVPVASNKLYRLLHELSPIMR